jgi:transposase-like protein
MDINLMTVQTRRKKEVKLTFPKLKDGMLRPKMLREKDH